MKFNELQKYLLKVYAIVILFFIICVPSTITGETVYGFIFIDNSVGEINTGFIALEFLGITLATLATIFATNNINKK